MINTEQFDGHTPGPWVAKFDEHGVEGSLVVEGNKDDGAFGNFASPLWVGESDKNMPDARLIAAAPDLLADNKRLREEKEQMMQVVEFMTGFFIKSEEHNRRLQNALMTCAQTAGDDPFFNEGGEGYEALFAEGEKE